MGRSMGKPSPTSKTRSWQVAVMGLYVSGMLCATTGHTSCGARPVLCSKRGVRGWVGAEEAQSWRQHRAHLPCPSPAVWWPSTRTQHTSYSSPLLLTQPSVYGRCKTALAWPY